MSKILTPIYEQLFSNGTYGFRPERSQHQALEKLFKEVSFKGKRYIIDADMQDYFGSINHQCLREFLDRKIKDGVVRKMIDKWLKAGILEEGQVTYPTDGMIHPFIDLPVKGVIWYQGESNGAVAGADKKF